MYKINPNNNQKEWYFDRNKFIKPFIEKSNIFDIRPNNIRFYSQQDEDKYIIQYILKEKINDGTFIEIGGCDGILYSNTKTLEDFFGFNKGIIIEPIKHFYDKLIVNRPNCYNFNCAVSNNDEKFVEYSGNDPCAGINMHLIEHEKLKNNPKYNVINKKMCDIITESKLEYIDIFSIDVEGSELEILKSTNFNIPIFCIIIEANSSQPKKNEEFGNYLKEKGFTFKERQRRNEIWFNHNYFRKHLFNVDY